VQLIGLLDSPYVRRVAVSLQLLALPFEHRPISVFRGYEAFRAVNPVVKAPTLVCDDGTVLMDSTLILDYAEALAAPARSLMPREPEARKTALRTIGLALAACEKSVQIYYELELRPPERRHEPWLERIRTQQAAAFAELERDVDAESIARKGTIDQAWIASAIAWHFAQSMLPQTLEGASFPRLRELSAAAERLPAFMNAPHGEGTLRATAR